MEIVSFELAKKLKEKGFRCKHPIAMYNEDGMFCPLYTSADHNEDIKCIFGNREYYDYDDFDSRDFIAPTISQVLKWLRKKKNIFVVTFIADDSDAPLTYEIYIGTECLLTHHGEYFTLQEWDKCNLVGIEYVIDNLI